MDKSAGYKKEERKKMYILKRAKIHRTHLVSIEKRGWCPKGYLMVWYTAGFVGIYTKYTVNAWLPRQRAIKEHG